jgi:hypothetical protein
VGIQRRVGLSCSIHLFEATGVMKAGATDTTVVVTAGITTAGELGATGAATNSADSKVNKKIFLMNSNKTYPQ